MYESSGLTRSRDAAAHAPCSDDRNRHRAGVCVRRDRPPSKASPLVGYLLAGVLIGPFTPGFVADQTIANELSELGIILLMFGVGLQFSLEE